MPSSPQDWSRFEVHPDNFNAHVAESLIDHWFTLRYEWWEGRNPEFAYRGLRPKVIVEELIKPKIGVGLVEVKAFVFNGDVEFFRVFVGGVGQGKEYIYLDRAGNKLPITFSVGQEESPHLEEAPSTAWLSEVTSLARKVSKGLDFIRVDFLTSGEDIYIGELTNYPMAGNFHLRPELYEAELGSGWTPRY